MWITSMEVQTEQNIEIAPTGDSRLCYGSETLPGAAPFYMYENLSWIHDIHYRWGLPFCTPVTGAEFSMIRTPTTTQPPTPFLSFSHPSFHTSTCPPIEALFHPSPGPFHPSPALWSLIISSFHKSNLTSLLPPIRPSFLHLFRPSPIPWSEWARNMWPVRREPAGPSPAVPPYVDLSPLVLYWFCFKQVKNTRRMRCRRWHEIKKIGKGKREWMGGGEKKRKSPSPYQMYELGPGWI